MAFLIDNLQYYLQVDVLDAQWQVLTRAAEDADDFEKVRCPHSPRHCCRTIPSPPIYNLQYYLQVDELDAQWQVLTRAAANADDFEKVFSLPPSLAAADIGLPPLLSFCWLVTLLSPPTPARVLHPSHYPF
jgi:hypothetical protein